MAHAFLLLSSLTVAAAFHLPVSPCLESRSMMTSGRGDGQVWRCLRPVSSRVDRSAVGPLNQFVKGLIDEEDDKIDKADIPSLKVPCACP